MMLCCRNKQIYYIMIIAVWLFDCACFYFSVVVLRDPWGHTKPGREWRESQPGTFMIGSNHLFK